MVLFSVLIYLYADDALPHIFTRLVGHWSDNLSPTVSAGALCQARYRLGVRPLVMLFYLVCRVDSTKLDVPDTAANEAAFGRHHTWRGTSAWQRSVWFFWSPVGPTGAHMDGA